MKKVCLLLVLSLSLFSNTEVLAHHCHSHYYVTYKDYFQDELVFNGCDKHSVLKETTVYYYSNGTRRSYITNTIFNKDGSILASGCSDVKHLIYNKKHYFTFYKNKKYQIISEDGNLLSVKNYKEMQEISPNRLLVKLDKKWGIINLQERIIVPIKYKKFEQINNNLFLTKINGYYGMIDASNKILVRNEHEKIKPLYNTYLLKKEGKYGLTNNKGGVILDTEYDKIKKLGEYIIAKKDGKFLVLDTDGNFVKNEVFKKIKFERNTLELQREDKTWITIHQEENML